MNAATLIRRGQLYMKLKKYGQACEDYKRAMTLAPDNPMPGKLLEELDVRISEMKESE
jgi:cytochrome c-type biogenesis protein CcmH/NrfG